MKVVCLISSNNKVNMIAGKVWGMTENIFSNHNFEFHRIEKRWILFKTQTRS